MATVNIMRCMEHSILQPAEISQFATKNCTFIIEFELHSLPIDMGIIGMDVSSVFSTSDESLIYDYRTSSKAWFRVNN